MRVYINDKSFVQNATLENIRSTISRFKEVLKNTKVVCCYSDLVGSINAFVFGDEEEMAEVSYLLELIDSEVIENITDYSQHNYLYIKSDLSSIDNICGSIIAAATDKNSADVFMFNFVDDEYSSRPFIPVVKVEDKHAPLQMVNLKCLPQDQQDLANFIFIHTKLTSFFVAMGLEISFDLQRKIDHLYVDSARVFVWDNWHPEFAVEDKQKKTENKETLFPLVEVIRLLLEIAITGKDADNYTVTDFKKFFADVTKKKKAAEIIAEINGWILDRKLSSRNKRSVFTLQSGRSKGSIYLAVDTEKGDFEVHDSFGAHLGALSVDISKFEKPKGHKLQIDC